MMIELVYFFINLFTLTNQVM